MRCDDLARALSASADGEALDGRATRHVEACLRCQAELAQYRKLVRVLRALRTEVLAPGPCLAHDVLAGLEQAGERSALRSLVAGRRCTGPALVGMLAAVGTASSVAVIRRRRAGAAPTGAIVGPRRRGQ